MTLADIAKRIRRYRKATGRTPAAIRIHSSLIDQIYPRTSIRGDYFSLLGIPLHIRSDCPRGKLYFVSDEDFRVVGETEK